MVAGVALNPGERLKSKEEEMNSAERAMLPSSRGKWTRAGKEIEPVCRVHISNCVTIMPYKSERLK